MTDQVHNLWYKVCISVLNQAEPPEQYIQDQSLTVASPSSVLMYEQDVSDMQKSLLSPCSNHGNLAEGFESLIQGVYQLLHRIIFCALFLFTASNLFDFLPKRSRIYCMPMFEFLFYRYVC